jgi:hypothetical protein
VIRAFVCAVPPVRERFRMNVPGVVAVNVVNAVPTVVVGLKVPPPLVDQTKVMVDETSRLSPHAWPRRATALNWVTKMDVVAAPVGVSTRRKPLVEKGVVSPTTVLGMVPGIVSATVPTVPVGTVMVPIQAGTWAQEEVHRKDRSVRTTARETAATRVSRDRLRRIRSIGVLLRYFSCFWPWRRPRLPFASPAPRLPSSRGARCGDRPHRLSEVIFVGVRRRRFPA